LEDLLGEFDNRRSLASVAEEYSKASSEVRIDFSYFVSFAMLAFSAFAFACAFRCFPPPNRFAARTLKVRVGSMKLQSTADWTGVSLGHFRTPECLN
jgi:hypothetical protein